MTTQNFFPNDFLKDLALERGLSEPLTEAFKSAVNGDYANEIAQTLDCEDIEAQTRMSADRKRMSAAYRKRMSAVYDKFDISNEHTGPVKQVKLLALLLRLFLKRYRQPEAENSLGSSSHLFPNNFLEDLASKHHLSKLELDVFLLAANGYCASEIAENLKIDSLNTVRKRMSEIYSKFNLSDERDGPVKQIKLLMRLGELFLECYRQPEVENSSGSSSNPDGSGSANTYAVQDWNRKLDVSIFYGRTEQRKTLKQWIVHEKCRVVGLVGTGGIGKTALSVKVVEEIMDEFKDEFKYVIWRSLYDALPIKKFLVNLIEFLVKQKEIKSSEDLEFLAKQKEIELLEYLEEKDLYELVSQLIMYLHQSRCLLILDDVETVIHNNNTLAWRYNKGYDGYGILLKRLGEEKHQSCLLVSSLEKPQEIALLESPTGLVRSWKLEGLEDGAAKQILKDKGLPGEAKCEKLIKTYQGNPLALKLLASMINLAFNNDVSKFLEYDSPVICDMFRELLDWQFQKLSSLQKEVMYYLSNQNTPVSFQDLWNGIHNSLKDTQISLNNPQSLIAAVESLEWRSLIEKIKDGRSQGYFTLGPVIKKYTSQYYRALITSS